ALISSADEAYTVSEGDADMQELCCVLGSRERDSVIREIERSYHGHRKRK
ncbi:MAG TPA: haloacid dehalogenase, partial [Erysipelotrichaceae bacterium]|nr:haloacid dehalogenase [Erysipelotrichaceae bacterium]